MNAEEYLLHQEGTKLRAEVDRLRIDRLRAELASCRSTVAKADDDLYAAERAIARVRELCVFRSDMYYKDGAATRLQRDVLRALDGDTE